MWRYQATLANRLSPTLRVLAALSFWQDDDGA